MANETRLIDANEAIEKINCLCVDGNENWIGTDNQSFVDHAEVIDILSDMPTVDAVSRGVVDQIRWERYVAIKQLEEHGIPFCGVAPDVLKVVRCKDCAVPHNKWLGCPKLRGLVPPPDFYCAFGERKDKNG